LSFLSGACGIEEIPVVSIERMREIIGDAVSAGKRVAGCSGTEADGKVRLFLAMMSDAEGTVELSSAYPGLEYSSFTVDFPDSTDSSGKTRKSSG
jgi:hypothetical protein